MRKFKTVFMRGGTSKGCMFHKRRPSGRQKRNGITFFTVQVMEE